MDWRPKRMSQEIWAGKEARFFEIGASHPLRMIAMANGSKFVNQPKLVTAK
jgi:hypothetical protein